MQIRKLTWLVFAIWLWLLIAVSVFGASPNSPYTLNKSGFATNLTTRGTQTADKIVATNFTGNAAGLTNFVLLLSGSNAYYGYFTGNGAGLTNISPNNLVGDIVTNLRTTLTTLQNGLIVSNGSFSVWQSGARQGGLDTSGNISILGTFTGNGSGLTNLSASSLVGTVVTTNNMTIIRSNFISGMMYSNSYGVPLLVSANAVLTTAAVNGDAGIDLRITGTGGTTNSVAAVTTVAVTLAMTYTNSLSGIVPVNGTYTFTNTSTGSGNTASLTAGQIAYISQWVVAPVATYKVYRILLTQTLNTQSDGTLTIGHTYNIVALQAGDDFSNVGYVSDGVDFVSTGTTPTDFTHGTQVDDQTLSAPVATVMENTVGAIVWSRIQAGVYKGTLTGAFPSGKTFFTINSSRVTDANTVAGIYHLSSNQMQVETVTSGSGSDTELYDTAVEILVYP